MASLAEAVAQALGIIEQEIVNKDRQIMSLVSAKDQSIKNFYEIRLFIEQEMKKKIPADAILLAVLNKLKPLTPHGKDMLCDN